jgi:hypothetical protein
VIRRTSLETHQIFTSIWEVPLSCFDCIGTAVILNKKQPLFSEIVSLHMNVFHYNFVGLVPY